MLALKIAGVVVSLFLAGLLTSFAEYKANYSLYLTIVSKLFHKKI